MEIKISYVCTLPLSGNSPSVIINEDTINQYYVVFIDKDKKEIVNTQKFYSNTYVFGYRQWFTNWRINIFNSDEKLIYTNDFDLTNKTADELANMSADELKSFKKTLGANAQKVVKDSQKAGKAIGAAVDVGTQIASDSNS